MPKIIPYNPALKPLARKLRKEMTLGEVLLWNELKEDKLWGLDFDRQRCLDNYTVDFYCKELMLAIGIDGMSHNHEDVLANDEIRQQKLERFGVAFVRFSETDVKYDMLNVMRGIENTVIRIIKKDPNIKLPTKFPKEVLER